MGIRSFSFSGDFDSLSLSLSLSLSSTLFHHVVMKAQRVGQDMSVGVRAGLHVHLVGRLR